MAELRDAEVENECADRHEECKPDVDDSAHVRRSAAANDQRGDRHRIQWLVHEDGGKRSQAEQDAAGLGGVFVGNTRGQRDPVKDRVNRHAECDTDPVVALSFGMMMIRVPRIDDFVGVLRIGHMLMPVKRARHEEHRKQTDHHPPERSIERSGRGDGVRQQVKETDAEDDAGDERHGEIHAAMGHAQFRRQRAAE